MAKGFIAKRAGTTGVVADVDNSKVLTTVEDLTAGKYVNRDAATFTTDGVEASVLVKQPIEKLLESSIYGANALQRTKNRLKFLGNTLL